MIHKAIIDKTVTNNKGNIEFKVTKISKVVNPYIKLYPIYELYPLACISKTLTRDDDDEDDKQIKKEWKR